jgi:hypothetical protein
MRRQGGIAVVLLFLPGCADVWGFQDVTLGDGGGVADGTTGDGSSAGRNVDGGIADSNAGDESGRLTTDAPLGNPDDGGVAEGGGCATGLVECDGGCVDLGTPENCGTCGNACTTSLVNAQAECVNGTCSSTCSSGYSLCNGACVQYSTAANCGSCGAACSADSGTPVCAGSGGSYSCVSTCPSAMPQPCNGSCVDTTSNAGNCGTCSNACSTSIANARPECVGSACTVTCNTGYTLCNGVCVNFNIDNNNCGGCGSAYACAGGTTCTSSVCTMEGVEAGTDGGDGCPDGGCPNSTATGFSCPFGSCNGNSSECTTPGGCFCSNDNQCLSTKCVDVTGENDVSCGSNCTGSGGRDGFNCELASPGIPAGLYACPTDSGYDNTTLSCDPTHTNCYCTADNQCPSGKCIPSTNNGNCSNCSGIGTADYRGCQAIATIVDCPIYVGCPSHTTCQYPTCYCTSDVACDSGHCIPSSHNANCSGCTGTGADDGHGCEPAPSSVPCMGTGDTNCTTTLTPAPVPNSGNSACICVADSDCSSGKCLNSNGQCTGTCTGSGSADSEGCQTATSVANAWSCLLGNCNDVPSPSGMCTSAGVPCWCTSDAQCPSGACVTWAGCAQGACTGAGTGNAFNCSP